MQSDARIGAALEALSGPAESFRSAVAATVDQVRSYIAANATGVNALVSGLSAELGPFAAGRIDVERLSSLFEQRPALDALTLEAVEKGLKALSDVAARANEMFVVDVAPGGSLRDEVARALQEVGRVFGAARIVELSRNGRDRCLAEAHYLDSFPFGLWSKAQRRLAPPLVVQVDGSDVHAAGLAEFLDGSQKLVLVVRGDSAPAPLVRLISPGTFVLQTLDQTGLDRLAAWDGPGVAALVPEGTAQFVHDPAAGPHLWERLVVTHMPEGRPRKRLGGLSAAQQAEELDQLRALASRPAAAAPTAVRAVSAEPRPAAQPAVADPVDKLAAWLMRQAGLDE